MTRKPYNGYKNWTHWNVSLWLLVAAAAAAARSTLLAALTVAFVTLGRWLGMREEDE